MRDSNNIGVYQMPILYEIKNILAGDGVFKTLFWDGVGRIALLLSVCLISYGAYIINSNLSRNDPPDSIFILKDSTCKFLCDYEQAPLIKWAKANPALCPYANSDDDDYNCIYMLQGQREVDLNTSLSVLEGVILLPTILIFVIAPILRWIGRGFRKRA